ncbi:MAG: hypothetical protein HRT44_01655 [Bdellovibrionales bacterium]|nr:hypothetical protein [Bdellovibrionales bacterium]NQZ17951.1 hypothetical protein [Bdellovibrionales bacterium]
MKIFTILVLTFFSFNIWGHPTSFKGSKGIMGYHSPLLTHNQINYSAEYWWAIGVHHISVPNLKNKSATFATSNFLLKRWNGDNYQANLYGVIGAGQSDLTNKSEAAGFGLIQFDIEDREYYFLAKHMNLVTDKKSDFYQNVIRLGIAPYIADFDGIHSWLILEWQESVINDLQRVDDLTPFLRIFYKNLLFEVGQSFNGITRFNYIVHF